MPRVHASHQPVLGTANREQALRSGTQQDFAAAVERGHGIAHQIEKRLNKLLSIGPDFRNAGISDFRNF